MIAAVVLIALATSAQALPSGHPDEPPVTALAPQAASSVLRVGGGNIVTCSIRASIRATFGFAGVALANPALVFKLVSSLIQCGLKLDVACVFTAVGEYVGQVLKEIYAVGSDVRESFVKCMPHHQLIM